MATIEPSQEQVLRRIHDDVAVFVKQLDDLSRGLTQEQAMALVEESKHLLTVVTFLRDATIDLLESAGLPAEPDDGASAPIDAE
jgi:hypothetical protein